MAVTIMLARHGQTKENVRRLLQGQLPGELTDEGRQQARQLRDRLQGQHFDLIITSDLKRAADTALIINEALQVPVVQEPLLRERDFGIHTGMPYAGITGELDPSAETIAQLFDRATRWLHHVVDHYDGQRLLVVSHGLFLRVIQGAIIGGSIRDIAPMVNAETRTFTLSNPLVLGCEIEETGAVDK